MSRTDRRDDPRNWPVVIFCGGRGTRLGSWTQELPKPLIHVGHKPILWHVMKIYATQGYKNFILCLGYKGAQIREYFSQNDHDGWNIRFVNTGLDAQKSERLSRVQSCIETDRFFLAYGDDVADIDLGCLIKSHVGSGCLATITAVRMSCDFGLVDIARQGLITTFQEKPRLDHWINGGFMILRRGIFRYLKYGELEDEVFKVLVRQRAMSAYKHHGSWKAMNTLKDHQELTALWNSRKAFWKSWKES